MIEDGVQIVETIEVDDNGNEMPEIPEPESHSLLEVWRALLSNIESQEAEKISSQQAFKLLQAYPFLKMQELPQYSWGFYSCLKMYRDILDEEIATDPECFKHNEPADDAEYNRHHYLNLLVQWQKLAKSWQDDWNAADNDSHIWLASYADSQNFIMGEKGIVTLLDQIPFSYTEDDAAEIWSLVVADEEG